MNEVDPSADLNAGKKSQSKLKMLVYVVLFLLIGGAAFQGTKLYNATKRKEAEEATAAQVDEARRLDVIKYLDSASASIENGQLEEAGAALKQSRGLDIEGLHSARFDTLNRRYQLLKKANEEAKEQLLNDVKTLDRDLDSAGLVNHLLEVEKRVDDLKSDAAKLGLKDTKPVDLVAAKFEKRARSITNVRYQSLMDQVKSSLKAKSLSVRDAKKLGAEIKAQKASRFIAEDLRKQGTDLESKLGKRLVMLEMEARFRKLLEGAKWDEARSCAGEMVKAGANKVVLEQEVDEAIKALEERKLKVAELVQRASTMDNGHYNSEALILLDEALRLDPQSVEAVSLRRKIAGYSGTLRIPGDFASLDEAIAAAKEGDKLILGKGSFHCSLKIEKALSLEGQGVGVTILETSGESGAAMYIANQAGLSQVSAITIQAKDLVKGDERFPLVLVEGNCLMEDVEVVGASGHGIALVKGRLDMKRCTVSKCAWDGVTVRGEKSHVVLTDCLLTQNGEHGVDFWEGGVGTVFRTKIQASGKSGIVVSGPESRVTVANVVVEGSRDSGLFVNGGALVHMDRLVVNFSQFSGIVVQGEGTRVKFSAVTVSSSGQAGVLIDPSCGAAGIDEVSGKGNVDGLISRKKLPAIKK